MPASSEPRRWNKKRKRDPQISHSDEEDDDDLDHDQPNQNPAPNPLPAEVVDTGVRICDFPVVVKHAVNRYHPSVLEIMATERAARRGEAQGGVGVRLENLSHGQLQTVSVVPRDCPLLTATGEVERVDAAGAGFVITPPRIVGGRGVVKRFGGRVHVVPMHADWFSPNIVHRLERQVVPHFFTGKLAEDTPEKYMECRNRIVAKYMENPERRLTLGDCQEWVTGFEIDDLTRVVRFLEHWGIINYCASGPNKEPYSDSSFLREDTSGEVHVPSAALKSIDSLIQFDKPKCKFKTADIYPSWPHHDHEETDLDIRIREHLSDNKCNFCSHSVPIVHYQSQKEADLLLCVDCYNDGRFVPGHSSLDFVRVDASRDYGSLDGESWTDQETLLLLEAVEIYNDNWNEIAEYVGSKSKAQCILQFIQLPTEDGPLENVEVPSRPLSSKKSNSDLSVRPHSSSNDDSAGSCVPDRDLESELPFASSANPVMSLVAFLASAVGPRVAAACAPVSLSVLSGEDSQKAFGLKERSGVSKRTDADVIQHNEGFSNGEHKKSEDGSDMHGEGNQNGQVTPLSAEKVRAAVKAGLSAAATKAKLFADHEEREIQRLSANIINHQLKRLELKLKQFAEVETQLMKECEQVERLRQRFIGERTRMISALLGNTGSTSSMPPPGIANNTMSNRQPMAPASSQPFVSSGFNNNQQMHPQFMGQQQMYGLGPRLPLSALHPSSSATPNAMFNSPPNAQPVPSHPMMRSLSGANSSLG